MRIELTSHATTHEESSTNHAEKSGDPFSALLASHAPPSAEAAPKTMKSAQEQAAQSPDETLPSIPPVLSMPIPNATLATSTSAVTIPVPHGASKSAEDATTISAGKKRKKDDPADDADATNNATKSALTAPLPPPMKPPPDVMSLTLALKTNVNDASASTDDSASNGDAPKNGSPYAPQNPLLNATPLATQTASQSNANANRDDARATADANANARASSDASGRANMATYANAVSAANGANAISIRDANAKNNAGANADASEGESDEDAAVDANRLFAMTRDTLRSTAMDQPTTPAPPPGASAFPQAPSLSSLASRSSSDDRDARSSDDGAKPATTSTTSAASTPVAAHAMAPAINVSIDVATQKTPEKQAESTRFSDALISNVERVVSEKKDTSSFEVRAFDGTKVAVSVEMEGQNVRVGFSFDAKHSAAESAVRATVGNLETRLGERGLSTVVSIAAANDKRAQSFAQVSAMNGSAASGSASDSDDRNRSRGASYEALVADIAASPRARATKTDDANARVDEAAATPGARRGGWVA